MPDTIDGLVRAHADHDGDKPMVIDTDGRITICRTRRHDSRPGRGVHRRRSRQGQPRRADHAQLCAVGADRRGTDTHRRGAGAAEHAAAAARTRRAATRCLRAIPRGRAGVPRPPLPRRRGTTTVDTARAARGVAGRRAAAGLDAPSSTRSPKPSRPATRSRSCSRPEAAARPRASSTRTATRWARCGRVSPRGASTPTPDSTCRCRSSGWAASAAVCCRRCWPAPPWSPNRFPGRYHAATAGERACHAVSRLARPGRSAGTPNGLPSQPICRHCDPAAWRRCYPRSNGPRPGRGRGCSG